MTYILLFVSSVFLSSVSQIILKKSALKDHKSKAQEYLNIKVFLAYGLFLLSSLMTTIAYKTIPISLGPILESLGYIFVAVLGRIFLKESISQKKCLGLILILIGMIVFNIQ